MALKKIFILVSMLLAGINFSIAQSRHIDSFNLIIKQAKHDTIRFRAMVDLSKEIYVFFPDSLIPICRQAISLIDKKLPSSNPAETKSYLSTKALALSNIGTNLMSQGKLDSVLNYWNESIQIREKIKDQKGLAAVYGNISFLYGNQGNFEKRIGYALRSLKIYEDLGDLRGISLSFNNLGSAYLNIGEYEKAMDYFKKSTKIQRKIRDRRGIAYSYMNLGNAWQDLQDPNCKKTAAACKQENLIKSFRYYELSLGHMSKIGDRRGFALNFIQLGNLYKIIGDPDFVGDTTESKKRGKVLALEHFVDALNFYESLSDQEGISATLIKIGECDLEENNLSKAFERFTQALGIAQKMNYPNLIESAAYQLYKLYEKEKKYEKALEMQNLYVKMKNILTSKEAQKTVLKAQIQYDYDKKSLADSLKIEQEKDIYTLQIENQRNQKLFLGFIAMLILGFAVFIFRLFNKTRKQNLMIENINKDLARQHILNQKIFSVISHDFRGPILSLKYVLDSFKTKNNDHILHEYLQTLSQELNTSTEMLTNLLNWAKTEISLENFENLTANISQICLETQKELKQKIEDKKLNIHANIPEKAALNLPPDILRIAIRNLLSNAIKFSYPEGKIEIGFDTKTASLFVKDNGKGMSQMTSQKLFKQEVDTDLGTANEEGFGMGLYIVAELLYKYGYKIQVESKEGEGACFKIYPI